MEKVLALAGTGIALLFVYDVGDRFIQLDGIFHMVGNRAGHLSVLRKKTQ